MISKLDYRCKGQGCPEANHCRRFFLTLPKGCVAELAAFDHRREYLCIHFLPRIESPVEYETEGGDL